jgi:hypothetical protein
MAWHVLARSMGDAAFGRIARRLPSEAVALGLVLVPLAWVSLRVFRARQSERLAFSYLLWIVSIASFVPQIANDYSLAFLPIAAVGCFGWREHWSTWVFFAIGCLSLQPFAFPVSGLVLLVSKLCGVVAIGQSVARRASEAPARVAPLPTSP